MVWFCRPVNQVGKQRLKKKRKKWYYESQLLRLYWFLRFGQMWIPDIRIKPHSVIPRLNPHDVSSLEAAIPAQQRPRPEEASPSSSSLCRRHFLSCPFRCSVLLIHRSIFFFFFFFLVFPYLSSFSVHNTYFDLAGNQRINHVNREQIRILSDFQSSVQQCVVCSSPRFFTY